jgi:hypothetical protein
MLPPAEKKIPAAPSLAASTRAEKFACFFLIAGVLFFYESVFFEHAINAGQGDDMVDVLWFFEIFLSREHWQDWFAVVALPNHEHITIFNHLVYLADYAIFRQVNFLHYIFIGHLIVLACCLLFAEFLQKMVGWWYALAIAFGLFLNLFYWHASFWAITALSNQAVVLFALLAARSLAARPDAIMIPLLWSLLAVTTQFNGLLVLPALTGALVFSAWVNKAPVNHRQCLIFIVAFLVTASLYIAHESPFVTEHLWHYVNYTEPQLLNEYLAQIPMGPANVTWFDSWKVTPTLFALIGATVFGESQLIMSLLLGAIMLVWLALLAYKTSFSADTFWLTLLFFALLSMCLIAIGRGIGFGMEAGLLYRYRLYSFILLLLCVAGLLKIYGSVALVRAVLFSCLAVQFFSLPVIESIRKERDNVRISYYNWLIDGGLGRSQMTFYPHNQDWRLFHAYERGYYNPYQAIEPKNKPVFVSAMKDGICGLNTSGANDAGLIQAWSKKPRALAVEINLDVEPSRKPVELWFCGNAVGYLFTLDKHNFNNETGKYWPLLVLKKNLPPSQYRVFMRQADSSIKLLGDIAFP